MRKHFAVVCTYGHLDLRGRNLEEIRGYFAYTAEAAFQILRPQIEGKDPITRVLITGGKTLAQFGDESEASSLKWALHFQLHAIIASYREQGIDLDAPEIRLEEEAIDTYRNLLNSIRTIEDEIDDEGVVVHYICDSKHYATPEDHWSREVNEVLGEDRAKLVTFQIVTCKRPYDRHPFNNQFVQILRSGLLFIPRYRRGVQSSTVRLDVRIRGRVRQITSWRPWSRRR